MQMMALLTEYIAVPWIGRSRPIQGIFSMKATSGPTPLATGSIYQ